MRSILIAIMAISLVGCSALEPRCPGTRSYDPQVCRGEKPQRLSNFPYEALQREQKCNACIDIASNCVWGVPPKCERTWR